jgi:hypothetical protein
MHDEAAAGLAGSSSGRRVALEPEGAAVGEDSEELPWQQRALDNLWLLLAISIVVPGVLYLGWGLWELAELPTWGGR